MVWEDGPSAAGVLPPPPSTTRTSPERLPKARSAEVPALDDERSAAAHDPLSARCDARSVVAAVTTTTTTPLVHNYPPQAHHPVLPPGRKIGERQRNRPHPRRVGTLHAAHRHRLRLARPRRRRRPLGRQRQPPERNGPVVARRRHVVPQRSVCVVTARTWPVDAWPSRATGAAGAAAVPPTTLYVWPHTRPPIPPAYTESAAAPTPRLSAKTPDMHPTLPSPMPARRSTLGAAPAAPPAVATPKTVTNESSVSTATTTAASAPSAPDDGTYHAAPPVAIGTATRSAARTSSGAAATAAPADTSATLQGRRGHQRKDAEDAGVRHDVQTHVLLQEVKLYSPDPPLENVETVPESQPHGYPPWEEKRKALDETTYFGVRKR